MKKDLYGTKLYINSAFLANNINYLKRNYVNMNIIAMIKANAYGHGDIAIAKIVQNVGVSCFGVADFEEGIRLRNHGIKSSIMVMNPSENNLEMILENNLEPVIYNHSMLSKLILVLQKNHKVNRKNHIRLHIKINTGMNRWGFDKEDIVEMIVKLKEILLKYNVSIGSFYSHLASSKLAKDDGFTKQQITSLQNYTALFYKEFNGKFNSHIANSAAVLRGFNPKKINSLRVGLLLYGGIKHKNIIPIAELKCSISQIRIVNKGDSIGYNRSYIAKNTLKIGVVPFGYADGLQRGWGNGVLKFSFKNKLLPTVGDISMDSCIVDLSSLDEVSIGDEICYFGKERPIWDLAKELNTIPYEITSILSRRIKRIYE